MNTVETIYTGGLRTEMVHVKSGQAIITDAPVDNQGKGEAFSPTDLFSASLGSCMLTIMGIAAEKHGFSIEGAKISIVKIMVDNPRRISEIRVELVFPKLEYTEGQKRLLDHISKTCPVALSIHPDIKQIVNLHYS
jgi:putative redox protein